jgi:nuclear pore complex protein Nup98-Nup96
MHTLYHEYYGDQQGALEKFIQCGNWKKAHTIFMTCIAHTMFLSCKFSLQCTEQIF